MHQLSDYADKEVLMVVFTCNHCPEAQAAEVKIKEVIEKYQDESFGFVAISGNSPKGLRVDELRFSIYGDSYEEMVDHAKEYDLNYPYLFDGEDQKVTMAYGARSTPHVFIFDKDRILRYNGRLDSGRGEEWGDSRDAVNAVDALLAGKEVEVSTTRSFGCSTKWIYKQDAVAKDNATWAAKPVGIESLDKETLVSILENDQAPLRIVNVWATWCGPCVSEMPDLVDIYRQYQHRLEFVTISIDQPKHQQKALDILEDNQAAAGVLTERFARKGGRSVNNFIWHNDNLDELADTLDPEWQGPVPYTLLVAPGGEIIYRHSGEIEPLELRKAIIEKLGRFWD